MKRYYGCPINFIKEITNARSNVAISDPLRPPIPQDWRFSGMGKATKFKFCAHIHRIVRNKSSLKISAQPWAYSGTLDNFQSTHIKLYYIGESRVIFAVAQLSCKVGYQ